MRKFDPGAGDRTDGLPRESCWVADMGCKPFCPDSAYGMVPARVGLGGGIPFGFVPFDMGGRGVGDAPAEYLFGLGELEVDLG